MIRYLRDDEPLPDSEPRRYRGSAGYVRLRWRLGPGELVEALEHRVLVGRPAGMDVHHINGVKDDNRIENLQAIPRRDHMREHNLRIDEKAAAEMYASGMSTVQIGESLSHDASVVWRALDRQGVKCRSFSEALTRLHIDDQVRELHALGWTQMEIATTLGVSRWTLSQRYRKLGLKGKCGPKWKELDR